MTLAIDHDNTFTADPTLWHTFIRNAQAVGHKVIIVTNRHDTEANEYDVMRACSYANGYVFAGDRLKRDAAREAGWGVDVWIDDMPETIGDAGATLVAAAQAETIAEYVRERDEAREELGWKRLCPRCDCFCLDPNDLGCTVCEVIDRNERLSTALIKTADERDEARQWVRDVHRVCHIGSQEQEYRLFRQLEEACDWLEGVPNETGRRD